MLESSSDEWYTRFINEKKRKEKAETKKKKVGSDSSIERPTFESIRKKPNLLQKIKGIEPGLKDAYKYEADFLSNPDAVSVKDAKFYGADLDMDTRFLDRLRKEGLREAGTDSVWRQLQQEKINRQAGDVQGRLGSAQDATLSNMAMRGGLSAGARERMGAQGVRDSLMAQQGIYGLGLDADIADEEMRRKSLADLGVAELSVAGLNLDADQFNAQNRMATDQFNIGNQFSADKFNIGNKFAADQFNTGAINAQKQYNIQNMLNDITNQQAFDMTKFLEEMRVNSSQKIANATPSSRGKAGPCCFIFLEARYGDGTMDEVVRRFRDENMTEKNRRGYYKLSEVLVPLMRKYPLVKSLVRLTMTDPLVAYGKYHYKKSKFGKIFSPVKKFWLKTFEYLGGDHKFIRENGEVV